MKRTPLIAGNWKMNTTTDEAIRLVKEILERLEADIHTEVVLCPPFISLYPVFQMLSSEHFALRTCITKRGGIHR